MWQRRLGRGDGLESHNAHGNRDTSIQQHHHRAIAFRDYCGCGHGRNANRFGGSIQRKLHVIHHDAQFRLGDHCDCGRITRRGLRYAYREVHPGQRQFLVV